ncbi:MAG: Hpt domain-containing protein [Gemmatimonadota bacterium]|nr:Hpt domain-containing protein [Gemmatimonadota bacterium]MDE3173537.1 Hpt domain-containing protein [Gemmatimonadota bacterium]
MPPIDPAAIARLRRFGGDALLFEMIDLLLVGAPQRLEAAHSGDLDRARAALHSLKSTAGQLGAAGVQALCEEGERAAGAGDAPGVAALLPRLDAEFEAARRALSAIREGGAA